MRDVKFLVGIQGTGKSTWAKSFVKKNKSYHRISRDDFRHMMTDYDFNHKNEKIVDSIYKAAIKTLLETTQKNIVLDEMNLNQDRIKEVKNFILSIDPNVTFSEERFECSLEESIERDKRRPFSVGERAIRQTYNKYYVTKDTSWRKQSNGNEFNFDSYCIICDIDGTLADKGNRNAYDMTKVLEDKEIVQVAEIVRRFNNLKIIIFSGRDDSCRIDTEEWLKRKNIPFDELHMRKEGDNRKDSIVKRELFDMHIRDKYFPLFVIDDRPQVCDMWVNELGLFLINVNQDPYCLNDF